MMEFCESIAKRKRVKVMYCHTRDSAVNFYSRNNYEKEGEYFDEDGIPHLKMIKKLKLTTHVAYGGLTAGSKVFAP